MCESLTLRFRDICSKKLNNNACRYGNKKRSGWYVRVVCADRCLKDRTDGREGGRNDNAALVT